MRFRILINASVLAVVAVGSLSTVAASAHDARPPKPQEQTLRSLAARHGLYFGTAVDPAACRRRRPDLQDDGRHAVLHRHRRERDEVGEPRADPRHVQLGPGRRADRHRRAQPAARPRPRAELAQPAAGLAHRRHRRRLHRRPAAAGAAEEAHHRRRDALPRPDLAVGRGQRGGQRPVGDAQRDPPRRQRRVVQAEVRRPARPGLPRRRVPHRARRRPEGAAVLQRLQHRGVRRRRPRRQDPVRLRPGQAPARTMACRSTASAARGTWAPSTATTTSSRWPTRCGASPTWASRSRSPRSTRGASR